MHPFREFAEPVLATHLAQLLGAVVISVLLLGFQRIYRHGYLRQWAFSFSALSVHLLAVSAILLTLRSPAPSASWLLALNIVALGAAYPHIIWMMTGAWTAGRGRELSRTAEWLWIGGGLGFGVATALIAPLDPDQLDVRLFFRTTLRYALSGTAFLVAAVFIAAVLQRHRLFGPRVLAVAFALYGTQLLHIAWLLFTHLEDTTFPGYMQYLGVYEFFSQMLIGLGLVIWLLELERREAGKARHRLSQAGRLDSLTGLPNRSTLLQVVAKTLRQAQRTGRQVAILSLGMTRYPAISQSLGWRSAEGLIERAARRLQSSLYPGEVVGRTGDYQFLVILPDAQSDEATRRRALILVQAMREPFLQNSREIYLGTTGGLSVYPAHGRDVETLIARAEEAQVESRELVQFSPLGPRDVSSHAGALKMESDLRRGWREFEFEMYYQPMCRAKDQKVVGFEALLRWNHPRKGLLTPGQFLPVAAGIGLLDELEGRILEQSIQQLAAWQKETGHRDLAVSVNLSAHLFQDPDLVNQVTQLCRDNELNPSQVHLEITENVAMQDLEAGQATVGKLAETGFVVSLDDFGTGFSSLSYLRQLPASLIKLDQSFLDEFDRDQAQKELIRASIALAHSLDKQVVAEGVETREHLEFLVGCNCDYVQGFYLYRPMPAHDVLQLLNSGK